MRATSCAAAGTSGTSSERRATGTRRTRGASRRCGCGTTTTKTTMRPRTPTRTRAVAPKPNDDPETATGWEHITPEFLWNTELARRVRYLDEFERAEVRDALEVAFNAHDGQARKSGEPYITHPVAVAAILAEMELDHESLVAGLLHDTVEDTDAVTFESLEKRYGTAVRRIVEGETKVSKVSSSLSKESQQINGTSAEDVKSEDLAQMFLAMTEEVRIIIVKLADRLHNMRTLEGLKPEKRVKIANETLLVFAPLAKLLGMYKVKNELEDLSFRYANPDAYAEMSRRCDELSKQQESVIQRAAVTLQETMQGDDFLRGNTVGVTIQAKAKELYGLHRKLSAGGRRSGSALNGDSKNIDDIFEVAQLRVILHDTGAMAGMTGEARRLQASRVCYHVLGIVHAMWPPVPGNMKDYIATPKLNGYKALHTVILPISPDDANPTGGIEETPVFPMEIMIRTEAMHILAENGIAADAEIRQQWRAGARRTSRALRARRRAELRYAASQEGRDVDLKAVEREEALDMAAAAADKGTEENVDASLRQVAWLKNIQSWQKEFIDVLSAREFVDTITSDLLGRRVFVFTPKGQVTNLPHGATVVDYAFYTGETGMLMEYAKVNGVQVEFDHVLTNAEVVEIFNEGKELPAHVMLRRLRKLRLNASTRSARAKIQKQLARLGSGDIKELRESLQVEALTLCGESIPDNLGPGPRTVTYCAYMFELVAADRTGLLATVSAAITKSGANIDSYTGVKVADDCFKMSFAIHFDDNELRNGASLKSLDENLSRLFTEVTSFKGVASGSLYCDVDAAVRAAGQE